MPVSFSKFQSFVEAVAEKVHNLGSDNLTLALTNSAPNATDTQLSQITEVAYTYCSARVLQNVTSSQTGGTYTLSADDLVLSASGGAIGPFQYVVLFNDTATNDELIGYYDYGAPITVNDGESFTFDIATSILTLV